MTASLFARLSVGLALALSATLASAQKAPPAPVKNPTYTNPVIAADFPDPFILKVGTTYYAYATNSGGLDVPVQASSDLVKWQLLGDALWSVPSWAIGGYTWAPEVMPVSGGYVMYFTARDAESGKQCIGAAFSQKPRGPFKDDAEKPLVCQIDLGGSIDPSPLKDASGARYLYWKNDGNCCGLSTTIWAQELSADGLKLQGRPTGLLSNDAAWEGNLIEAPKMYARAGKYYLFYSAANYDNGTYAVGYALGFSPLGPFKKQTAKGPWLATQGNVAGPGGEGIVTDGQGNTWLSYHAWTAGKVGYENGGARSMRLDKLTFPSGLPTLAGPSTTPRPAPAGP